MNYIIKVIELTQARLWITIIPPTYADEYADINADSRR